MQGDFRVAKAEDGQDDLLLLASAVIVTLVQLGLEYQ